MIPKTAEETTAGGLPIRDLLASLEDLEDYAKKRAVEYATAAYAFDSHGVKSWKADGVTYYRDSITVSVEENISYDARTVRGVSLSANQLEMKECDWLADMSEILENRLRATSEKEKSKREFRLQDAKNAVKEAENAILRRTS